MSKFLRWDVGQFVCATGVRSVCCEVGALEAVQVDTLGLSSTTPAWWWEQEAGGCFVSSL